MKFSNRILSFLLAVVIVFSMIPVHAHAEVGGDWEYTITDDQVTITGYTGSESEVVIPATIEDKPVVGIGSSAFMFNKNLTSVTIPESVENFGECVFMSCSNLSAIVVDENNPYFSSDDRGVMFDKNKTVLIAAPGAISGEYTIPNTVTTIGSCAFQACANLTGVTIPDSVTVIDGMAFESCSSLATVTIPAGVTEIVTTTFAYCNSLDGVWVDENNPYMSSDDRGVLFNKEKTQLIMAPMTLSGAYTIPSSVNAISESAFQSCESLTSVVIPEGVTTIESYTFSSCALEYVMIPSSVTTIGEYVFNACWKLEHVLYAGTEEQWNAMSIDESNGQELDVAIIHYECDGSEIDENGVCSICPAPDPNLEGLTYFLDEGAITITGYDGSLSELTIPSTIDGYTVGTIHGFAFSYSGGLTSVTIPDSVTSMGEGVFYGCSNLTSVTLPAGLTSINNCMFQDCIGLTDVTIPASVTSIGNSAFYACNSMTSLILPAGVTSIGDSALDCGDLQHVLFKGTEAQWNAIDISSDSAYLTDAIIHYECTGNEIDENGVCSLCPTDPCASGHDYQDGVCVNCSLLEGMTYEIENDQVTITGYSGSLTSMIIPSTIMGSPVVAIGDYAFADNTNLITVSIPDCVETIDERAFYNCSNMIVVGIGNAVETIGAYAFYNCLSLEGVVIGNNVSSIGEYAFGYCPELTDVTLPDEVTNIGMGAFAECGSLINITIGSSVQTIGESAFANTDLRHVLFTGTEEQWKEITIGSYNDTLTDAIIHYNCTGDEIDENGVCSICPPPDPCLDGHDYEDGFCTGCGLLEGLNYEITDDEVTITSYYGSLTELTIPATIEDKPVVAIGDSAFSNYVSENLTSVTIPDGVKSIGDSAFSSCSNLTSITIPGSVESVGSYAFSGCASLTSVTLPAGITSVSDSAFYSCSSLESITIPDSVKTIGDYAFTECTSLTSVTMGNNVESIGIDVFFQCGNLESITLSDSLTSISDHAFYYCTSLESITIPDNVTTIDDFAFLYCTNLTSITLGSSIETIHNGAFNACSSLQHVLFKGSEAQWDEMADVSDVGVLMNAIIHYNCTGNEIGENGVCSICAENPCAGGHNYEYGICTGCGLPDGLNYQISNDEVTITSYTGSLNRLIIPATIEDKPVVAIGDVAFFGCDSMISVTIPDSVTTIGEGAFVSCTSLGHVLFKGTEDQWSEITIADGNEQLTSAILHCNATGNEIIGDGSCTICPAPDDSKNWEYTITDEEVTITGYIGDQVEITIPETIEGLPVVAIGEEAFFDRRDLSSVTISDSVEIIGDAAFSACTNLENIVLGESVTTIGAYAFSDCSSLTSFYIPASVTDVSNGAFNNCVGIPAFTVDENNNVFSTDDTGVLFSKDKGVLVAAPASISGAYTIPNGVISISTQAFAECRNLTSVTMPDTVTDVGTYAFGYCENLQSITLSKNLTTIAAYAFSNCTSLTSITIPDSVDWITVGTFENCESLTSIVIPNAVIYIGDEAFSGCSKLSSVTMGTGVQMIDSNAFSGCTSLTSVTMPDSLSVLGTGVFEDCSNLEKVTLSKNLTSIPAYTFYDCNKLSSITIPNSVQEIGEEAFFQCVELTNVVIPDSVKIIGTGAFRLCWSLESVTLSKNLTSMGADVFYSCSSLTSVTIPDGVAQIGASAFMFCTSLNNVVIPGSVQTIGDYAFNTCTSLKNLTIENGVKTIAGGAFYCSGLTKVSLPNSVTSIGDYAFSECVYLETITIGSGVKTIGEDAICEEKLHHVLYTGTEAQWNAISIDDTNELTDVIIHYNCTGNEIDEDGTCSACNPCAAGHDYQKKVDKQYQVSAATCTAAATYYKSCSRCGKASTTKFTSGSSLGHKWSSWVETKPATTTSTGQQKRTCQRSGCDHSETKTIAKLIAPVVTASNVASTGKVKLTWNKIDGATKYEVYRATSKTGTYSRITTVSGTSVTNTSAVAGKTYYYKVRAVLSAGGYSAYSDIVNRTCDLAQPEVTASNVASTGKVKLTWEKVEGAAKYEVYRATSKTGTYSRITTVTGTSVTNTSATAGKTYYYKVKAIHDTNSAATSAESVVVNRTCDLAQPKVTATNVTTSGKVKLTWEKVEGAAKYEVYRATSKTGTYSRITTVTGTSVTNTSTTAGKTYYYKVRAIHGTNSAATSAYSSIVNRTCGLTQPRVTATNVESTGKVKLTWEKVEGAAKYEVYRATSKTGTYSRITTVTGTSVTNTSATAGKTYYYKVRAIHGTNSSANSAYSTIVNRTCDLARPDVTAKLSSGNVKLSWEKISGASKYEVYRATSKTGTYSKLTTITGATYTDKSVKAGKTYYYKVRAIHSSSSANSAYSTIDSVAVK